MLLGVAMMFLGGCYGGCYGASCYVVARWLLGVARWLLGVAMVLLWC